MTCSILVPAAVAAKITRRLARLAKQCGVELATPAGTSTLYRRDSKGRVDLTRAIECARLTVGDLPRTNGFGFVGKLTHTEAGNIIALAPGEQGAETPVEWRTCKATCDHCGTSRRRADTFVIRTPDGAIRRIGRNCLADFLAGDAASFIALGQFQDAIRDLHDDGEWSEGGGGGWCAPTTEHYLACAVSSIEHHGFFKRGGEGQATADHAAHLAGRAPNDPKMEREWRAQQPTAAHIDRAREVLAWVVASTETSDYAHNLRVACAGIIADRKFQGIIASAPQALNREQGRVAERAARAAAPDAGHLGEVGKRLDFAATVVRVKAFETMYGGKLIIAMRTADGHDVITFTTGRGCSSNDVGKTFEVRGTVKKHSEYQGRAQTELSRCAFAAVEPDAETTAA